MTFSSIFMSLILSDFPYFADFFYIYLSCNLITSFKFSLEVYTFRVSHCVIPKFTYECFKRNSTNHSWFLTDIYCIFENHIFVLAFFYIFLVFLLFMEYFMAVFTLYSNSFLSGVSFVCLVRQIIWWITVTYLGKLRRPKLPLICKAGVVNDHLRTIIHIYWPIYMYNCIIHV